MKIPSIFKPTKNGNQTWHWPSCNNHPKTLSFRAESCFTDSSESPSFSTDSHSENPSEESVEMIIQRIRSSERLFFEPGDSSSILKESKSSPFEESVAVAFESDDPYLDFKKSMQEMMENGIIKDWDWLEELVGWYLQMNDEMNHGFIIGAFVDLIIERFSSADSSFS